MAAGVDSITVQVTPNARAAGLKPAIAEQFPALRQYVEAARFAINGRYAAAEQVISPGDEVAMITMVSGG